MHLANLDHLYLNCFLWDIRSFTGCSKLLLQAARQLCKSDWITWLLPPSCSRMSPGCNLNVSWTPEIFSLASAGSFNWSFLDVDSIILLLLMKKKFKFFSAEAILQGPEKLQGGHATLETINTLPYDSVHGLATTHIDTCLICRRWQDLDWEGGQGQWTARETGICYTVYHYSFMRCHDNIDLQEVESKVHQKLLHAING